MENKEFILKEALKWAEDENMPIDIQLNGLQIAATVAVAIEIERVRLLLESNMATDLLRARTTQ